MFLYKTSIQLATLMALIIFSSAAYGYNNANDQLDTGIDLYEDHRFENAATQLYELLDTREYRKLDATEKYLALSHLIYSLLEQDKASEAMRHTSSLLRNTQGAFGKKSEQYVEALHVKARVQYRAGKDRDAIRTAGEMAYILEHLGNEYTGRLRSVRLIPRQIRKKAWNKKRLRMDLSDFYTKCEAISAGDNLPAASRTLHEFMLVGRDYRPVGRIKRAFKRTYIKRARENSSDRANRLIFIPDEKHLDDWCVVYPDGKVVDRAVIVPPEG